MTNRFLRNIAVAMFRIDWRMLLLAGSLMTTAGIVFQVCMIQYPLTELFLTGQVLVRGNKPKSMNSSSSSPNTFLQGKMEYDHRFPVTLVNRPFPSSPVKEKEPSRVHPRPSKRQQLNASLLLGRQRSISSMGSMEALVYAKKEIVRAPTIITSQSDLHPPLFKNISIFQRSYELMEKILKIYVYRDGARPIFHQPHLRGIYASEGWFMKLMEANRQFTSKDPERAHLFYLPYSARQLELALYVPGSHDLKPLSLFLRDYINTISSKYPFWNRTHGADHFLVACHDWGPYTVKEHYEMRANTIKALCNADASEGVFVAGKDVSLPETTIRMPRKPLRSVGGGKRVSQRPILAFFAGNVHGRVRPVLLEHWKEKDNDMRIYGPLPRSVSRRMSYAEHMRSSRFCICPMGFEVNSPRIVEAIYHECVPVIIADNFILPFYEVLDWTAFSITVAEKDIPRLKDILIAIPLRRYLTMLTNVKRLQRHFVWNPRPARYDLFHMILHSLWTSRLNQIHPEQSGSHSKSEHSGSDSF